MDKKQQKIKIKPKSEWNEYEKRLHTLFALMKMDRMLKEAIISYPTKPEFNL